MLSYIHIYIYYYICICLSDILDQLKNFADILLNGSHNYTHNRFEGKHYNFIDFSHIFLRAKKMHKISFLIIRRSKGTTTNLKNKYSECIKCLFAMRKKKIEMNKL